MLYVLCLCTSQTSEKIKRVFFPGWCATGSSFPAGAQEGFLSLLVRNMVFFPAGALQGLLSLLVRNRVFSPCRCATWSFPCWCATGSSQIYYFLKFCHGNPNKMAIGHKTHKLGRLSSNDHNCQIRFTSLHVLWRKCNLTIFSL